MALVFFPVFIVIIIFPEHGDHLAQHIYARLFKLDLSGQKLKSGRQNISMKFLLDTKVFTKASRLFPKPSAKTGGSHG